MRELVAQTSGIADYYEERGRDGKTLFDRFVEDPRKVWTVDEMIARVRDELHAHFPPGTAVFYSDTNYLLLGKLIENVTHQPLGGVLDALLFRPLGLQHTWLIGDPAPQAASSVAPAAVLYHDQDITKVRASREYWADGGIVSTAGDMIAFLRALNRGEIVTRQSLATMQSWRDWHQSGYPPGVQYGYGLWYFQLPGPMSALKGLTPTWGASGSTGSFLYYSADLDLYMAGTIDSASSNMTPYFLMGGVLHLLPPNEVSW